MDPIFNRIILKLSGEAMAGDKGTGINSDVIKKMALEIKKLYEKNVEIAIVVGGGNFWRGRTSTEISRTTSDHIGMLGTVMNGLALRDILNNLGIKSRVQSAINLNQISEMYTREKALEALSNKEVVIFVAGLGNPYFSTDTAAALRAAEIGAEVIISGKTGVDGVYDSDPNINPKAKKFDKLTYMEVLRRELKIMDSTATSLCMENNIPLLVFGIDEINNISNVVFGQEIGTVIEGE